MIRIRVVDCFYFVHLPLEVDHPSLLRGAEGSHDGLKELLALLVVEELAKRHPDYIIVFHSLHIARKARSGT